MRKVTLPGTVLLALLLVSFAPGHASAANTSDLAGELNSIRQQKRQLEREVAQRRASIDLLRASGAGGIDSSTLQSLSEEVGRTRAQIQALEHRELELLSSLSQTSQASSGLQDPAASEVARLRQLLNAHYAGSGVDQEATQAAIAPAADIPQLPQVDINGDKVLLTGSEGVAAINFISEQLSGPRSASELRDVDLVFNIETRVDGNLVGSSNHSLRALGNDQYIGKVALRDGENRIKVRSEEWRVQIEGAAGREYLVTLQTAGAAQAQLFLIPVDELLATGWTELPDWLPPMGASASRS